MKITVNGRVYKLCTSCWQCTYHWGLGENCNRCEAEEIRVGKFLSNWRPSRFGSTIIMKQPADKGWYKNYHKSIKEQFESKWEKLCGKKKIKLTEIGADDKRG